MKATIVDLRYRTKDVLNAVAHGETVTVLYRGKPKAQIVPVSEKKHGTRLSKDKAFGLWKDNDAFRDVSTYVRKLRRPRVHDL